MIYESNWGPVYYCVSGPPDGLVVVYTHGVSMDCRSFAAQETTLAERYRVLTWDLPGHGQSFALRNGFAYDMAAKCLIGILDQVGVDAAVLAAPIAAVNGRCLSTIRTR